MYDWLTGLNSNGSFVGSYLLNPNSFNVGNLFGSPVGYGQPSANAFLANTFTSRSINSFNPFVVPSITSQINSIANGRLSSPAAQALGFINGASRGAFNSSLGALQNVSIVNASPNLWLAPIVF